jgi:YesN/AraC family two-component response regulator
VIKVLIADDQAMVRTGFGMIIGAQPDMEVVGEAADGVEALDAVQALTPDVVLLDIHLPGVDGFAVAETLAGRDRAPIVVLVSSRARLDYGNRVDESCAHGFIAKADLSGETLWRVIDSPDEASRCGA